VLDVFCVKPQAINHGNDGLYVNRAQLLERKMASQGSGNASAWIFCNSSARA